MNVGDTVIVKGVPPNLKDDEQLKTRTLFEKCVGGQFVIAGIEQPEGFPHRLVRLDVGHVVGEAPFKQTIWIEEEFVEVQSASTARGIMMGSDFITCPVWPKGERQGHRYRPYFGKCTRCGIKIALNEDTKRLQDAHPAFRTLCPQCTDSEQA